MVQVTDIYGETYNWEDKFGVSPTQEQIETLADLKYAAITTGVPSVALAAAEAAVGIEPGNFSFNDSTALLESYGYTAYDPYRFYDNAAQSGPNDAGLAIHLNSVTEAIEDFGYLESTTENIEKYGDKIDPNTGELYKFIVNDNIANQQNIQDGLAAQGIPVDTQSTVAILPTDTSAQDKYTEEYDTQNASIGGDLDNALQWAQLNKLEEEEDDITTGTGTGLSGSGTGVAGAGGISGNYTNEADTLTALQRANMPGADGSFNTNNALVTPGPSGTYTVPAQTFGANVANQVNALSEREEETAALYQPQTIAEKQAAGQDVSAYQITQKLYRNPNTGAQLYIVFQGGQPLQPIPAGYIEVQQSGQLVGAANVYNPLTAGGNTYTTGAYGGGYIQGFSGEDGSTVTNTALDPNKIYGNVSFQDPVTGQTITQTPAQYLQSLGNRQAQATFNPATMVSMPGTSVMTEATSPGTILESTAGQSLGTAPMITGTQLAQVSDVSQAKGPGTPEIRDAQGNVISEAVAVPTSVDATIKAAAPVIKTELAPFQAETLAAPTSTITGQTQDTTSVSDLDAATGTAQTVADVAGQAGVPTRTLQTGQDGELITQTGVNQAQVGQTFGTGEVQAASIQDELATLMSQFDDGQTPAWAAGAMRKANAVMLERGLGASSMAGQAVIQAAMEAALPIAQIDAGNKQQMALFKAEQRSKFLQIDFDQEFQRRVTNAARVSEIANINFSADQQIALENSRAAQTMDLANLNNAQALTMSEAAALSQLDMASLSNLQQSAVQNAQNFLQLDMANLNNKQSTALFKAQSVTNAMLSDTAQANANEQFNATSENQMTQFSSNLSAQVSQFNAAQQNAINQFNAEEANAVLEFNSALQNQREMFNAQNYLVVAQANAKWRQDLTTANTAAQNVANLTYAKEVNGLTQKALDDYWQKERDIMSYSFAQAESASDRALKILLGEQSLAGIRMKLEFDDNAAKSEWWSDLLFGDTSFADIFKLSTPTTGQGA